MTLPILAFTLTFTPHPVLPPWPSDSQRRHSLLKGADLSVSQHANCVVRIHVLPGQGRHKFKISSVAVKHAIWSTPRHAGRSVRTWQPAPCGRQQ
eukprot:363896-Chlamydomonas_euryale.AAC.11